MAETKQVVTIKMPEVLITGTAALSKKAKYMTMWDIVCDKEMLDTQVTEDGALNFDSIQEAIHNFTILTGKATLQNGNIWQRTK